MIVAMSSAGLPGLNGFVGEFNILLGAFQTNRPSPSWARSASSWRPGTCCGRSARCSTARSTKPENAAFTDLNRREVLILVPLVILFFVIGLFPNLFLDKINPSAQAVADAVNNRPAVSMV